MKNFHNTVKDIDLNKPKSVRIISNIRGSIPLSKVKMKIIQIKFDFKIPNLIKNSRIP